MAKLTSARTLAGNYRHSHNCQGSGSRQSDVLVTLSASWPAVWVGLFIMPAAVNTPVISQKDGKTFIKKAQGSAKKKGNFKMKLFYGVLFKSDTEMFPSVFINI